MEKGGSNDNMTILPPFSVAFGDAIREFRQRDQFRKQTDVTISAEKIDDFSHETFAEETERTNPKIGSEDEAVTLFPRRKAGQPSADGNDRKPLKLSVEVLESFFGVPLHIAARQLVSLPWIVPTFSKARQPT